MIVHVQKMTLSKVCILLYSTVALVCRLKIAILGGGGKEQNSTCSINKHIYCQYASLVSLYTHTCTAKK